MRLRTSCAPGACSSSSVSGLRSQPKAAWSGLFRSPSQERRWQVEQLMGRKPWLKRNQPSSLVMEGMCVEDSAQADLASSFRHLPSDDTLGCSMSPCSLATVPMLSAPAYLLPALRLLAPLVYHPTHPASRHVNWRPLRPDFVVLHSSTGWPGLVSPNHVWIGGDWGRESVWFSCGDLGPGTWSCACARGASLHALSKSCLS